MSLVYGLTACPDCGARVMGFHLCDRPSPNAPAALSAHDHEWTVRRFYTHADALPSAVETYCAICGATRPETADEHAARIVQERPDVREAALRLLAEADGRDPVGGHR